MSLIWKIFLNCKSLTSLNLSNFDTSNLGQINALFKGCLNLEYINLQNFIENNNMEKISEVFDNIPENIVICLEQEKTKSLVNLIKTKSCYVIYCGDDWIRYQKKLIKDNNTCVDSCNNIMDYEFEFKGKCYNSCEYGFFYDKENPEQKKCKCNLDNCLLCSNVEPTKNLYIMQ